MAAASDSEDEHEIPASQAASSTFGSEGSNISASGIQPTKDAISYANAAAAGNEVPGKNILM